MKFKTSEEIVININNIYIDGKITLFIFIYITLVIRNIRIYNNMSVYLFYGTLSQSIIS